MGSGFIAGLGSTILLTIAATPAPAAETAGVVMVVEFHVRAEARAGFVRLLREDARNARAEDGVVTFELYQAEADPDRLFLFERWRDEASLQRHLTMPHTRAVLARSGDLVSPMRLTRLRDLAPLASAEVARLQRRAADTPAPLDLLVFFTVKPDQIERFRAAFATSTGASRPEPGNLAFHIHEDVGAPGRFTLYERWTSRAALDAHFAQPYTKALFDVFSTALAVPVEKSLVFVRELR